MMEELALHIMDILQNSLAAGANEIVLDIEEDEERDTLKIKVEDDGRGMGPDELSKVQDPFYTTKRKSHVGLGIPMFKWVAEHCDGHFSMESELGRGTRLEASFRMSHIDRPPMGDLSGTLLSLVVANPGVRFVIRYRGRGEFVFDSKDVKEILGDVPFTFPEVLRFLREYVEKGLGEVRRAI